MGNKNLIKAWYYKIALSFFMYPLTLFASAETLDTTFGQGAGWVGLTNGQNVQWNAIKIQGDNKILVAGYTQDSNSQIIVARYASNGVLDSGFGTNGIVVTNLGSSSSTSVVQDVALQADNKIVVTGYTYDGSETSAFLVRYTSAGAIDTDFGDGGITTLLVGNGTSSNAVAIQADTNIVIAGNAAENGVAKILLARFTSDGVLDGTFGTAGVVTAAIGTRAGLNAVIIDNNDKIVAAGTAYNQSVSSQDQYIITRYSSAGVLDTSFGTSGLVMGTITGRSAAYDLVKDASHNLVIAGLANDGTDQSLVARYTSAGVLDATFNTTGIVTHLINSSSVANALALQSNGRIMVGGSSLTSVNQPAMFRLNTNGSVDTTFGDAGDAVVMVGEESFFQAIAIQSSDGRTVAAGAIFTQSTQTGIGLAARFNINNTDHVTITSISDAVNTTRPTISGTSSAASANVRVTVNGVVLATPATDGSGNWNAGKTNVLPSGSNTILAELIVSSVVVVSQEKTITVAENFLDDAVFAYDTTTQTALTGAYADVTFDTNNTINTWSHTAGTASFTCNQAGTYEIKYIGNITVVANAAAYSASMHLVKNGTEIVGSQLSSSISLSATLGLVTVQAGSNAPLINSVLVTLAATDVIKVQALGANSRLAPGGTGTTRPSGLLMITRIA